jgi:hypothetical protein
VAVMLHRLGITTVLAAAAAALVTAASASASPYARYGVQDDAWLMYGSGTLDQRVATLQKLGVGIVRLTLDWYKIAPTKPADQRDPSDPAYQWGAYADTLSALHAAGIPVLVSLWGSPRWANGGHAPNYLPISGFGNFAYAAAREFPWVHLWTAWNEPNTGVFARPVSPRAYVQRVLNPAYAALHSAGRANRVAGGVTSPRSTPSGMSPLAFMVGMRAAHAKLDAYAQNPYPASPRETPFYDPCSYCRTLTMARLPLIRADVTRYFGSKPIWLTEYGYQTNPPDRILGVSYAKQASYEAAASLRVWQQAGVTILIHFLVRDEPELGGWQSGFFTAAGGTKPSYRGFGLPLAEVSRRGATTVVWGQVRPGEGRRRYLLQRWTGRRWVSVGGSRLTDARGSFQRRLLARPGTKLRVTSPQATYASPTLIVS